MHSKPLAYCIRWSVHIFVHARLYLFATISVSMPRYMSMIMFMPVPLAMHTFMFISMFMQVYVFKCLDHLYNAYIRFSVYVYASQ